MNFFGENPIDMMLLIIFIYPILKGFLFKFSSKNLKSDIEESSSYLSFIVGSILGTYVAKSIFIEHKDRKSVV
mgnify:FL=1